MVVFSHPNLIEKFKLKKKDKQTNTIGEGFYVLNVPDNVFAVASEVNLSQCWELPKINIHTSFDQTYTQK